MFGNCIILKIRLTILKGILKICKILKHITNFKKLRYFKNNIYNVNENLHMGSFAKSSEVTFFWAIEAAPRIPRLIFSELILPVKYASRTVK